jgi:hypothetical protein
MPLMLHPKPDNTVLIFLIMLSIKIFFLQRYKIRVAIKTKYPLDTYSFLINYMQVECFLNLVLYFYGHKELPK